MKLRCDLCIKINLAHIRVSLLVCEKCSILLYPSVYWAKGLGIFHVCTLELGGYRKFQAILSYNIFCCSLSPICRLPLSLMLPSRLQPDPESAIQPANFGIEVKNLSAYDHDAMCAENQPKNQSGFDFLMLPVQHALLHQRASAYLQLSGLIKGFRIPQIPRHP